MKDSRAQLEQLSPQLFHGDAERLHAATPQLHLNRAARLSTCRKPLTVSCQAGINTLPTPDYFLKNLEFLFVTYISLFSFLPRHHRSSETSPNKSLSFFFGILRALCDLGIENHTGTGQSKCHGGWTRSHDSPRFFTIPGSTGSISGAFQKEMASFLFHGPLNHTVSQAFIPREI